jgi:phenylalanyl-tRNA synthetase beta chain
VGGTPAGELGEIHPQILENWSVTVPCVACELDLDTLLDIRTR